MKYSKVTRTGTIGDAKRERKPDVMSKMGSSETAQTLRHVRMESETLRSLREYVPEPRQSTENNLVLHDRPKDEEGRMLRRGSRRFLRCGRCNITAKLAAKIEKKK